MTRAGAPSSSSSSVKLLELLELPDTPVELVSLVVAKDFRPQLDIERELKRIDALGDRLRQRFGEWADADRGDPVTLHTFFRDEGFVGARDDYYAPENSMLDHVVKTRRGIPLTLAVAMIAIARRANITLDPIPFPSHFLVRRGETFLDPFDAGRRLRAEDLASFAARAYGAPIEIQPKWLEPTDTRAVIVRMLSNLRLSHRRRGDFAGTLLACDRLVDIDPAGRPEHRRDRGVCALALGSMATAIEDLSAYLEARPTAQDRVDVERLLTKARRHTSPPS